MGWEELLKRAYGKISEADKRLVNYILRDGEFRTIEAIMDEAYDLIQENKKLGDKKVSRMEGRPRHTKFAQGRRAIQGYMQLSPNHEVRETEIKLPSGKAVKEYRYIGE